jgi:hypothetical protein
MEGTVWLRRPKLDFGPMAVVEDRRLSWPNSTVSVYARSTYSRADHAMRRGTDRVQRVRAIRWFIARALRLNQFDLPLAHGVYQIGEV